MSHFIHNVFSNVPKFWYLSIWLARKKAVWSTCTHYKICLEGAVFIWLNTTSWTSMVCCCCLLYWFLILRYFWNVDSLNDYASFNKRGFSIMKSKNVCWDQILSWRRKAFILHQLCPLVSILMKLYVIFNFLFERMNVPKKIITFYFL